VIARVFLLFLLARNKPCFIAYFAENAVSDEITSKITGYFAEVDDSEIGKTC